MLETIMSFRLYRKIDMISIITVTFVMRVLHESSASEHSSLTIFWTPYIQTS